MGHRQLPQIHLGGIRLTADCREKLPALVLIAADHKLGQGGFHTSDIPHQLIKGLLIDVFHMNPILLIDPILTESPSPRHDQDDCQYNRQDPFCFY